MKGIILFFTAGLFLLASCETEKGNPFELSGTIKGAENKKIVLETMTFPNMGNPKFTAIDTAVANEKGEFVIKDHLPERMICRVTVEGDKRNYYIVSLHNEKATISADLSAHESPKIEGSPATSSIFGLMDELRKFDESAMALNDSLISLKSQGKDSIVNVIVAEYKNRYYSIFKKYADSSKYVSNSILAIESLIETDPDYVKNYVAKISQSADSSSVYFKELKEKVKMQDAIAAQSVVGKPFIDIVQPDRDGKNLKLSDLKGKIVLIDFWASWCGPCRQENPNVIKVYNKYKEDGFTIYSVSLDTDKEKWLEAIAKDGLIWKTHVAALDDANNKAAMDYHITGIPMSFLVNRDGIIVAENLRGANLEKKVAELVQSTPN